MIVLPMAGKSSRFFNEGYKLPKYMLPLNEVVVLDRVVLSFEKYFNIIPIVFVIYERGFETEKFIHESMKKLSVNLYKVIELKEETRGQGETVYNILELVGMPLTEPLTIFNIDTFRPNFTFPDFLESAHCSYLETFIGSGKNWSNVVPVNDESDLVKAAYEKQEASKYCCTGLYHWESIQIFKDAYEEALVQNKGEELYVAPMYNNIISSGHTVRYNVIEKNEVIFCGVPDEYKALCK